MELKPEDLKIDVFHAKRPGAWSTAMPIGVSILHKPSGIIVTKSDERSVHMNRANAYADLCEAVAKYEAVAQSQVVMYGCHNKPRPNGATWGYVQDGYFHDVNSKGKVESRTPRLKKSFHVMSTECKYDKSETDSKCKGCKHSKEIKNV